MTQQSSTVLMIVADFYSDITNELERGATQSFRERDVTHEKVTVPGALEVPVALSLAIENGLFGSGGRYGGCVALGCVIRGETAHNEIVGNESARALLELAAKHSIPVGNGILTTNDRDQAWERASVDGRNKGADAANACLTLMELATHFSQKKSQ